METELVNETTRESVPKAVQWAFEIMAVIYVAVAVLFLVDPDWPILMVNTAFSGYDWPVVFFPTERFWFSLAVSVPGTRAFLAFAAARRLAEARLYVKVLQASLLIAAVMFALQFLFKHAPLYAIGFFIELLQVVFYYYLNRKLLPNPDKPENTKFTTKA